MAERSPMTSLLLVGKTGNGKSSTANTIVEAATGVCKDPFPVAHSFNLQTVRAESKECDLDDRKIKVISTPDLANPPLASDGEVRQPITPEDAAKGAVAKNAQKPSNERVKDWIASETRIWLKEAGGKPSAVLLVIRSDMRYTTEQYEIYKQLKEVLGDNMKGNLVVVFTMGDQWPKDLNLKEKIKEVCDELKQVLKDANQRFVLINNKGTLEEKRGKVKEILDKVKEIGKQK